ncbi:MAG: hypothetical protein L0Y71_06575 [Gemmataceae bacterium]|nr:hypothetical protein [Gemmataceae bacterium]
MSVSPCAAQEPVPVVAFEGSEIFCHILKHFKLAPIAGIDELPNYPADETLIVVFGDLAPVDAIAQQVNLEQHAILLASDRASGRYERQGFGWRWVESRLTRWRLKIMGLEVQVAPDDAYKQKRTNPFLKPKHTSPNHPIFGGLSVGLATNRPSVLVSDGSDLRLLAEFPPSAFGGKRRPGPWGDEMTGYMFGARADSEQRVLIIAGHGVFMNGMIAQKDNDNGLFTINTIRWLRGPHNRRKYALMIDNRRVIDSFDLPLTRLPDVPLPPVQVINQMLRELENEGVFNRFLEEVVGWPLVLRFAILVGTIGILLYGFYRLFPLRRRHESVPLIVGLQPGRWGKQSLLAMRQWEWLEQDNLWEASQALARQWFMDHAMVKVPLWDEAAAAAPPPMHVTGGWLTRKRLAQQVQALWGFAIRDPSQTVSQREFDHLMKILTALDDAARAGRLVFPRI